MNSEVIRFHADGSLGLSAKEQAAVGFFLPKAVAYGLERLSVAPEHVSGCMALAARIGADGKLPALLNQGEARAVWGLLNRCGEDVCEEFALEENHAKACMDLACEIGEVGDAVRVLRRYGINSVVGIAPEWRAYQ